MGLGFMTEGYICGMPDELCDLERRMSLSFYFDVTSEQYGI